MHFLCLHGMGTNSQILETSSATVRYELDEIYSYDFPEGSLLCPIAPELKGYFPSDDSYYQYFDPFSASSAVAALAQLDTYMEEEGPFDGIIGFSQGAALAATYLLRFSQEKPHEPLPFKCAIFFSGGVPIDLRALDQGKISFIDPKLTGTLLRLPTAHIWAHNDTVVPGGGEMLSMLCDDLYKNVYIHGEGHAIPGARAKEAVQGAVKAIKRTIDQAAMLT